MKHLLLKAILKFCTTKKLFKYFIVSSLSMALPAATMERSTAILILLYSSVCDRAWFLAKILLKIAEVYVFIVILIEAKSFYFFKKISTMTKNMLKYTNPM